MTPRRLLRCIAAALNPPRAPDGRFTATNDELIGAVILLAPVFGFALWRIAVGF